VVIEANVSSVNILPTIDAKKRTAKKLTANTEQGWRQSGANYKSLYSARFAMERKNLRDIILIIENP
jgi:hypothetical protein